MIVKTKKKLKFMNHNFIAIEGNIGVGKTSLARMISEDYNSKLKNFNDAERYYEVGLEINPNHVGILEYQGELYIETNRLEMAEKNLEKLNDLCIFNCTERNELRSLISSVYE